MRALWGPLLAFAGLVACGEEPGETLLGTLDGGVLDGGATADAGVEPPVDPTEAVFAPEHLIEVDVELAPEDWEVLRNQARTFAELFGPSLCVDSPPVSPYTYFPAEVTIDGQTFDQVGIRKKGFFGSVNPIKPSLKLKFDEYVMDQEFSGFERMTFNNGRQGNDRSTIHQCVGYNLFAAAGIAAPRCNHARISVNGEPLGVFVHIDSIKKRFLRRFFDDDEGALFEGALSDFRPVYIETFQRKTNKEIMDRSELDAVAEALLLDDSELLPALGALVEIDEFITFWALEVLIQHWDGYTSFNNNNYYIYKNPDTGRFHFIPWGADAILGFGPQDQAGTVFLSGLLARRLHEHPDTAEQFYVRLAELMSTVWDELEILTYIRETEILVRPYIAPANLELFEASLQSLRDFVQRRRSEVEALLAAPRPELQPIRPPLCLNPVGELSGTFETEWGTFPTQNPFAFGSGTFTATVGEQGFVGQTVAAVAGPNEEGTAIIQIPAQFADRSIGALVIYMPPERVVPGATVALDVQSPSGAVLFYIPQPGAEAENVGTISNGEVTFDVASTMDGAPIVGTFRGQIIENL